MVFNNCLIHFLNSIRDVNRIINVFQFKYGLMHGETNCIDLLAITTLQVSAPKIAAWIQNNSMILTGSVQSSVGITTIEQKEKRGQYNKIFSSIYPSNPDAMMEIIQALFPRFSWITGGYNYSNDSKEELRRKQRIALGERFDIYYNLSLEDIIITREEMITSINDMDEATLRDYIDNQMRKSHISEFLAELRGYINDIPSERLPLFFNELLRLQSMPRETQDINSVQKNMPFYQCKLCIYDILKRIEENKCLSLLSSSVSNTNFETLPFITELILDIESAWGKLERSRNYDFRLVSEESLKELEKIYLETINNISEAENLMDSNNFITISLLWRYLDEKTYREYTTKELLIASNVPKYLYSVAGHWAGGDERGWVFNEDSFSNYISKDVAYEKICGLKGTFEFSTLTINIKQICVAFHIWYNTGSDEYHNISEKNVDALIPSWEPNQSEVD